jgi:hypothetical protein
VSFLSLGTAAFAEAPSGPMTARQLVTNWRQAIHAKEPEPATTASLTTISDEDGIRGEVREWLTPGGAYRRVVQREFDESETVLTAHSAAHRDWNGFVHHIAGRELSRLRSAAFETRAIVFGPPASMSGATVSESDDHLSYLLRITPPGGSPMTWSVDRKTWLPLKCVRSGDDSEITTTYEDWRIDGQGSWPHRILISETNKPDIHCERMRLDFETRVGGGIFATPKPGPSDVHREAVIPPVPFNFENSHILLKVALNGREPTWFILDTGADQEYINETRLGDYGLKSYGKSTTTGGGGSSAFGFAVGATFTLPGLELRNQHVAVLDQSGLEHALGMPIGGLLGFDFISRFVVEIDYEKKLLTLHDPNGWTYSGPGFVVPITFDNGIPFANATISAGPKRQIPAYMVLDFGAAETMTLTSPFVKANDLVRLAGTNSNVNRPAGLENQFFAQNNVRGRIDELAFGKLKVRSIPMNMSVNTKGAYASANFAGTVGQTIFRRYHVFLDYARNRVIFEPTAEAEKPFLERRTYGLTLLASGPDLHTFTVSAVRASSPAEKDGFKKGDVISSLDGKPATAFTLGELRERLSHEEHHELHVTRGADDVVMKVEVKLVSLER